MAVNVDPKTQKLSIRFRVKGYKKQFYLSTGLKDSQKNRDIVAARWELIQREVALSQFDPTLERYKFGEKKVQTIQDESDISKLWEKFTQFKSDFLEASTIQRYSEMGKIIAKLPNQNPSDAVVIREILLKDYSYHTARSIVNHLSLCCEWAITSKFVSENPFKLLVLPKLRKSSAEKLAAYTLEQRDLIISAFENHQKFGHYANLIKFLFWTGCRPGEVFALTWGDVSRDCTKITICKAYASQVKVLKGTKNGKRRTFPAAPGGKLHTMLLGMRSCQPNHELVFKSLTGKQLALKILDKVWYGAQSRGYYYPGVVTELASKGIVPYLKLYSTRHTFATWAIASGESPDKVAYWLGDHVATVFRYYCHPEVSKSVCPDF
jgi:integrase